MTGGRRRGGFERQGLETEGLGSLRHKLSSLSEPSDDLLPMGHIPHFDLPRKHGA